MKELESGHLSLETSDMKQLNNRVKIKDCGKEVIYLFILIGQRQIEVFLFLK